MTFRHCIHLGFAPPRHVFRQLDGDFFFIKERQPRGCGCHPWRQMSALSRRCFYDFELFFGKIIKLIRIDKFFNARIFQKRYFSNFVRYLSAVLTVMASGLPCSPRHGRVRHGPPHCRHRAMLCTVGGDRRALRGKYTPRGRDHARHGFCYGRRARVSRREHDRGNRPRHGFVAWNEQPGGSGDALIPDKYCMLI